MDGSDEAISEVRCGIFDESEREEDGEVAKGSSVYLCVGGCVCVIFRAIPCTKAGVELRGGLSSWDDGDTTRAVPTQGLADD